MSPQDGRAAAIVSPRDGRALGAVAGRGCGRVVPRGDCPNLPDDDCSGLTQGTVPEICGSLEGGDSSAEIRGSPVCSMAAAEKGASKIRPIRKSSVSPYSWRAGEHSYEVVLFARSGTVRRHTRFRVEGGYFSAAAIRLARFFDF